MPGNRSTSADERAFGGENRRRLIGQFLDESGPVTPQTAWSLVYRLLMWVDRTTGLAHCYESDKCQPGRPWYRRSLAFHAWLARELGESPASLGAAIDWLFRQASAELAEQQTRETAARAAGQRAGFESLPEPGEDAELVAMIRGVLGACLSPDPPATAWASLTRRVSDHMYLGNKRQNLLGEGFEDTLAAIIGRLPSPEPLVLMNRVLLGDIPGFRHQGPTEKPKRVDLVVVGPGSRRSLVTAKWSIRADREEQFRSDFDAYARANASGEPFDYVLVTNELDPARLRAACRAMAANAPLFNTVVHVNPAGLLEALQDSRRGAGAVIEKLVSDGRPASLEEWLAALTR